MENLIDYLPQFVLWGSVMYFWGANLILLALLFISENMEEGRLAFVAAIAYGVIVSLYGDLPLESLITVKGTVTYLIAGLGHSLLRTYFYGKREFAAGRTREYILIDLKGKVFRWWFLAPISFLYWVFSDLVMDLFSWIYDRMSKIFVSLIDISKPKKEEDGK